MKNKLLQIECLSKKYSFTEALKSISFDIYQGEVLGLLGVNGAGKTTLSSIIATLIPYTMGEILWNGVPIRENIFRYRSTLGFCPQKSNLDHTLTLTQNLVFCGRYFGMSKDEIAKRKNELIDRFDLTNYLNTPLSELSGGYKQRFLLARTLMHNPSLIILDEPTLGLDPQVRHKFWDYITFLKKEGITIILTTHYVDEAELLADRVCIIESGTIKAIDTPQQLKSFFGKNKLEEVFLHMIKN